jgi:hypothetical protein
MLSWTHLDITLYVQLPVLMNESMSIPSAPMKYRIFLWITRTYGITRTPNFFYIPFDV